MQEKPQRSPRPVPDSTLSAAISSRLSDGKLNCADAFAIATQTDTEPIEVGEAADALSIRLARCQLGLFGYPGKQGWSTSGVAALAVPEGLEVAIVEACSPEGTLPCATAWRLADRFGIPRMQLGWVVEQLGIKIVACQLGAF